MDHRSTALALAAFLPCPVSAQDDGALRTTPRAEATLSMNAEEIPLRGGGHALAERGMLRVPIVRSDPASKEIQVEVWRSEEPARDGTHAQELEEIRAHPIDVDAFGLSDTRDDSGPTQRARNESDIIETTTTLEPVARVFPRRPIGQAHDLIPRPQRHELLGFLKG